MRSLLLTLFFWICLSFSGVLQAVDPTPFPDSGLVLWLDAMDAGSLEIGENSQVHAWRDRSSKQHVAKASDAAKPIRIAEGGKPMIRFTPEGPPTPLRLPKLTAELGPVTVFVVARRTSEQADRGEWQRFMSAREPETKDHLGNGLALSLTPRGKAKEFPICIYSFHKDSFESLEVTIGTTPVGQPGGGLLADVGEVLVFAKTFDQPEDFEAVEDYLAAKWGVTAARDAGGWTRKGPIPKAIQPTTPDAPLFDQANTMKWQPLPAMSDEFEEDQLDNQKWWDHYPSWHGRTPARFMPDNIKVADGKLELSVRKDDTLPAEVLYESVDEYKGYSAAAVSSKTAVTYGCFEVRIKPAHATCTSSFWFNGSAIDPEGVVRRTELDVFELPAGHQGFEKKFGMNMHVFEEPETSEHWSNWGNWYAGFNWSEDFHTVSFVWSPKWIRYYVDGHCVRTTQNIAWHVPLTMIFDMEIMSWLPFPDDSEFPAKYQIDYVRAWQHPQWKGDPRWTQRPDPTKATEVTKAIEKLMSSRAPQE